MAKAKATSKKKVKAAKRPAAKKAAAKQRARRPVGARAPARIESQPEPAGELAAPPVVSTEAPKDTRTVGVELEPGSIEESLRKLGGELKHWANKGRYTKVRFKFRGKQLLPDLPLAAVVAAEGLSFYWAGVLRLLVVNVAGGALLQVELVNDSEKRVQEGKEALLSGDLDRALTLFREAADMDRDSASAQLNIGVALKLKGDAEGARAALTRARDIAPEGPLAPEAERLLNGLPPRS